MRVLNPSPAYVSVVLNAVLGTKLPIINTC